MIRLCESHETIRLREERPGVKSGWCRREAGAASSRPREGACGTRSPPGPCASALRGAGTSWEPSAGCAASLRPYFTIPNFAFLPLTNVSFVLFIFLQMESENLHQQKDDNHFTETVTLLESNNTCDVSFSVRTAAWDSAITSELNDRDWQRGS